MSDEELRIRFRRLEQGQCIIVWTIFLTAVVIVTLNALFSQH